MVPVPVRRIEAVGYAVESGDRHCWSPRMGDAIA
jgi:hypothetical protein